MLFPYFDSSFVVQCVLTSIAVLFGLLFLVRKVLHRHFAVDDMSIGGSGDGDGSVLGCAVCGKSTSKKCSMCKKAWYCSRTCQSKHWEEGHKFKCKQAGSSDELGTSCSNNAASRRRKSSGFGPICLVPGRGTYSMLKEPKRILFPYDEFVKLFNWAYPGFPPCGLLNCGNSCFANVVLQCLTCTRPLVAYLLEKDHCRGCVRKQEGWCFLCELQVHVQRALKSREPFSPINILSRLPNIGGNLGYGSQEDAHEFMRFAIDTMQSACLDEYGGEKALDPSTQETTLIQHIFGGHLQSQVICTKCNTISNRYENMMDLTVEIHGDVESLEECLDQFTVKEWLDGENMYKCDGCNDYVKAWKRLTVHQAPNILTIALKRFQSGRFGKLNKRVTFPENLNLTPYMGGKDDGTDLYSLYAVVVHLDMLNASFFGHYICYIKDFEGRWYRVDDYKVTNVEVDEVLSQGAYMLLFKRNSPRREPFVRPTEPAKKKQVTLGDVDSNTTKAAGSCGVLPSFPSNSSMQSNMSLNGTENEREMEVNFDALEGKEREGVGSVTFDEINPMLDFKDLGDIDMTDFDISCPLAKDPEEGNLTQCSQLEDARPVNLMDSNFISPATPSGAKGQAMKFKEYSGISDAGHGIEDLRSTTEEVSTLSGCATDSSDFCKNMTQNMVYDMDGTSVSALGASSAAEPEDTYIDHNSESVMVACDLSANDVHNLSDICDSRQGPRTFSPGTKNGSIGKPKPLFSRGFLDKPPRERSVGCERTRSEAPRLVPKTNGYSNGHSELEADADSVCSESIPDRRKNDSVCNGSSDMGVMSPGFLKRHYGKSAAKLKSRPINCKASAEEASCSSQGHNTSSNGTVCNGESSSRGAYLSELKMQNTSNGGTNGESKLKLGKRREVENGRELRS